MKVYELIEILKNCNPEDILIYSIDDEGNDYKKVYYAGSKGIWLDGEFRTKDNWGEEEIENSEGIKVVCINS